MPSDGPVKYHGIRTDLVSAPDVPAMMRELCNAYNNALRDKVYSPLLASIIFLLDFICIYPFDDGTGRMSRLLASLMFDKIDFTVGRYVSIDSELEATQDEYFGTMKASAEGWETGDNDYTPFVEYMLGVILKCYDELTERTSALSVRGSNEKTIRQYFQSIEEPGEQDRDPRGQPHDEPEDPRAHPAEDAEGAFDREGRRRPRHALPACRAPDSDVIRLHARSSNRLT